MPGKKIGNYGPAWTLRVVPRIRSEPGYVTWGECDYANRQIIISKKTEKAGVDRETVMHEVLHKLMPFLMEDCVQHAAKELDDVLDLMSL